MNDTVEKVITMAESSRAAPATCTTIQRPIAIAHMVSAKPRTRGSTLPNSALRHDLDRR